MADGFASPPAPPLAPLPFTADVEAATAGMWDKVKHHVSPLEWQVHAPLIAEINRLKREKNAVILAHNYMTPEIFHGVGDFVGDSLALAYASRDGEQGYPGNLDVTVVYELLDTNELVVRFHAVSDQATPVNLTQHSYFNLAGGGTILGHVLSIDAESFIAIDAESIPTGELAPVDGTPFDFRWPQAIGASIGDDDIQLRNGQGYDHCFALNKPQAGAMTRAVHVVEPVSGRVLELFTEEPGVQFYSGNFLDGSLVGKGGQAYAHRGGFCLEPQHFPDSPNQPHFPNVILRPGEEYRSASRFRFSVER